MISTTDIPGGGGGKTPKTLQPGNVSIKVNGIYLDTVPWDKEAYNVMLDCESSDLGADFEGFFIDKDNEGLGRHKGQVGRVRSSQWAYQDKTLPGDIIIQRDIEITKFLKNLCVATGCVEWLEAQNNKHETIESLVEKMNEDAPFADKFMNVCLGGREYENKAGYTNFDLFFPKFSKAGIPFEDASSDATGRVYKFDATEHVIKKKVKEVDGFEADAEPASAGQDGFEL